MPQPTPPEPDSPHSIRLEAVTLVRGSQHVFEGLTLHLQEARIGLIGDNGAGKSSLFRLISGLDQPQQGRVVVHGCDTQADRRQLSKHVGLMFQNPDDQIIFPTVAEELAFSLTARGETRQAARQQARDCLARRGLEAWAARAVGAFRRELKTLSAAIVRRNEALLQRGKTPYTWLDPYNVSCSIDT